MCIRDSAVTSAYDQNLDQEEALQDGNPQTANQPEIISDEEPIS